MFLRARRARRRIPSPPRESVEPRLALCVHRLATSALRTDPPSEPAWSALWGEGQVLGVICDELFVPRGPSNSHPANARPRPPLESAEPRFTLWAHRRATRALISNPVSEPRRGWWRHLSVLGVIRAELVENRVSQQACTAHVHHSRASSLALRSRSICRETLALIGDPPAKTMGGKKSVWPRIKLVTARPQGRRIGARNWASLNPWGSGTLFPRRTR